MFYLLNHESTNPWRRITRKSAASDDFNMSTKRECFYSINAYTYLYFGGATRGQESTWSMSRNMYKMSFVVDDNDVNIDFYPKLNFQVVTSHYYCQVLVFMFQLKSVCLFGWSKFVMFSMSNEFFTFKLNENKGVVEIIQLPCAISVRELWGEISSV